jgi:hypothetical protein
MSPLKPKRGAAFKPRINTLPKTCRFRFAQPRRITDSCFKMHFEGESWLSYIPCGSASKLQGKQLAHALSYWSLYMQLTETLPLVPLGWSYFVNKTSTPFPPVLL